MLAMDLKVGDAVVFGGVAGTVFWIGRGGSEHAVNWSALTADGMEVEGDAYADDELEVPQDRTGLPAVAPDGSWYARHDRQSYRCNVDGRVAYAALVPGREPQAGDVTWALPGGVPAPEAASWGVACHTRYPEAFGSVQACYLAKLLSEAGYPIAWVAPGGDVVWVPGPDGSPVHLMAACF